MSLEKMSTKEELSGLENLLMYNDLSAEEYFNIVVSSSDLELAKNSVANVITKLRKCNAGDHVMLQNLFEDFFQVSIADFKTSSTIQNQIGPKPPHLTHHATPKQHFRHPGLPGSSSKTSSTSIRGSKVSPGPSKSFPSQNQSVVSKVPSNDQRKLIKDQSHELKVKERNQPSESQDSGNGTADDKQVVTDSNKKKKKKKKKGSKVGSLQNFFSSSL